jgi:hypothetical protein
LLDGGTVRLQALVGLSRALDLILTGRAIKAREAFEWGLANRLVACGTGKPEFYNLDQYIIREQSFSLCLMIIKMEICSFTYCLFMCCNFL